jgi:hypothetical protein
MRSLSFRGTVVLTCAVALSAGVAAGIGCGGGGSTTSHSSGQTQAKGHPHRPPHHATKGDTTVVEPNP